MGNLIMDIVSDTSNRRKHFVGGLVCGLLFTVLFAAGVATGMEFKDSYKGGKWDWMDWCVTVLGGVIGNLFLAFLVWSMT